MAAQPIADVVREFRSLTKDDRVRRLAVLLDGKPIDPHTLTYRALLVTALREANLSPLGDG